MTTDAQIVALARRMQNLQHKMWDLLRDIEVSDHPNAEEMARDLRDQCVPYAWPEHVISGHLVERDKWETGDYGIRHKIAAKAAAARAERKS